MRSSPELVARFKTDEAGQPAFIEADGLKHYKLVFELKNTPQDTYAATFELDPTYYDPVRTLRPDPDGNFRLETTAYGDYDILVRLRTKEGEVPVVGSLGRALQKSRDGMVPGQGVDEAIHDIASH